MRFQKITEGDVLRLHARYARGETARDLAAEHGMTAWALRWRFRQLGLSIWPSHRPAKTGRRIAATA